LIYPLVSHSKLLHSDPSLESMTAPVCSSEGYEKCREENRVCVLSEDTQQEEVCGNCAEGYIILHESQRDTKGCQLIDDVDLQEYLALQDPEYRQSSKDSIADEERLVHLKQCLHTISKFESAVPPPTDFHLEVNEYCGDCPEDVAHRAGFNPVEGATGSNWFPKFDEDVGADEEDTSSTENGVRRSRNLALTSSQTLPDAVNWVERGGVTSVKYQGRCSCCWAIS